MKPLIIYHKSCLDGAGAALAAYLKFGEEAEYRPAQYGDPAPESDELRGGREVYILDFSYPRDVMKQIANNVLDASEETSWEGASQYRGKLVVLDHHKTAQANLEGLPFCKFDMSKSGAMLAWEHFRDEIEKPRIDAGSPELFRYIQDRDLWQWRLDKSREISAALAASGALADFRELVSIYDLWHRNGGGAESYDGIYHDLVGQGAAILSFQDQLVEQIAKNAYPVTLDGKKGLAVNAPVLQSEVGEALALRAAAEFGSSLGIVWRYHGPDNKYLVSLRSRQTTDGTQVDVSEIARRFPDGGGHAAAAGFQCAELPWERSAAEAARIMYSISDGLLSSSDEDGWAAIIRSEK